MLVDLDSVAPRVNTYGLQPDALAAGTSADGDDQLLAPELGSVVEPHEAHPTVGPHALGLRPGMDLDPVSAQRLRKQL